jgi:hypothetical protein
MSAVFALNFDRFYSEQSVITRLVERDNLARFGSG